MRELHADVIINMLEIGLTFGTLQGMSELANATALASGSWTAYPSLLRRSADAFHHALRDLDESPPILLTIRTSDTHSGPSVELITQRSQVQILPPQPPRNTPSSNQQVHAVE